MCYVCDLIDDVDKTAMETLFAEYDKDGSGRIGIAELESILLRFGVAPSEDPSKKAAHMERVKALEQK